MQPLNPSSIIRVIFLHLFQTRISTEKPRNHGIPRHEGEIRIGTLVANKIFLALECFIQDAVDAYDLLFVALDSGLKLLVVEIGKPMEQNKRYWSVVRRFGM